MGFLVLVIWINCQRKRFIKRIKNADNQLSTIIEKLNRANDEKDNRQEFETLTPYVLKEKGETKFRQCFELLYPLFLPRLRKKRLDLHLVVYDAARPRSIQEQMWKVVENTDLQDFVANPDKSGGGPYNYGVAVNVALVDCTGHPIPMGSEYDYFGDRSRVDLEAQLIENGEINHRELKNRQL